MHINNECRLPNFIWPVHQLNELEKNAVINLGITLYELMQRAGLAIYKKIRNLYPNAKYWLILCGHGNNGGDGYVVANIARLAKLHVTLISCAENHKSLNNAVQQSRKNWLNSGGKIYNATKVWPNKIDVIIDALFGSGINRVPQNDYACLIRKINLTSAPVISIDMPSGLKADTGNVIGEAVQATHTISILTLKLGQITGKAKDYIGKLHYSSLGLRDWLNKQNAPISRLDYCSIVKLLKPRNITSHKGNYGRLLVIGGGKGFGGAVRMTAEAALRTGSGVVKVLTYKYNINPILTARPELIVNELDDTSLKESLNWANVIAIGPGLGCYSWSDKALLSLQNINHPMVWDADALIFLANNKNKCNLRIITPHPKEAANLLAITPEEVESDRLKAAQELVSIYGGITVLKGPGTIVASADGNLAVVDIGNAGLATAGTGDILTGIIASLVGQNYSLFEAACAGCLVHGAAANKITSKYGTRGMIATDLFKYLRYFLNPQIN